MKVLFINACVRENSRTFRLCSHFLNEMKKTDHFSDCEIQTVTLHEEELRPLNERLLAKRDSDISTHNFTDKKYDHAKHFASADLILIGAPYWDFSFPASLKVYFENICINQLTFYYDEHGVPISLCRGKKIVYITTSGGYIGEHDTGAAYVKDLCASLFNIHDFQAISAEGLDIAENDPEKILHKACAQIDKVAAAL